MGKVRNVCTTVVKGEKIYQQLLSSVKDRNISLRIVQNAPSSQNPDNDTVELARAGAEVRSIDFHALFGSGILHTKFWIIDKQYIYIGSANMDWRSLTQVKELGAIIGPCLCLSNDAQKLFDVYWYLAVPHTPIPQPWPDNFTTQYNSVSPMKMSLNGTSASVYFSSSPPQFCPKGRTIDVDSILDVIDKAKKFVYIAVMDYSPTEEFVKPKRFWPVIDDALRKVSLERGVKIRILASKWNHTSSAMIKFLRSLEAISHAMSADIQVKLFIVPYTPAQAKIPFARVNHNKYMVTDNAAYIGTSNWSGDYFVTTGGIGLIVNETSSKLRGQSEVRTEWDDSSDTRGSMKKTVQHQLQQIFLRDWNSMYAHSLHNTSHRYD